MPNFTYPTVMDMVAGLVPGSIWEALGWIGLVGGVVIVGWAIWQSRRARRRRSLSHELLSSMVDHAQRPRSSRPR